jgi:hypothetical protein
MNHRLDPSVAEELLSIKDVKKQSVLANLITDRQLSLRMTRKLLKDVDETGHFNSHHDSDYVDHLSVSIS